MYNINKWCTGVRTLEYRNNATQWASRSHDLRLYMNAQKTDCVRDLVFGMVEDGTGNEDAVHVSEIDDTHPSASPSSSLVSSYCSSPTPEEDALFDFR